MSYDTNFEELIILSNDKLDKPPVLNIEVFKQDKEVLKQDKEDLKKNNEINEFKLLENFVKYGIFVENETNNETKLTPKETDAAQNLILFWLWNPIHYPMSIRSAFIILQQLGEKALYMPFFKSLFLKNLLYVIQNERLFDNKMTLQTNDILTYINLHLQKDSNRIMISDPLLKYIDTDIIAYSTNQKKPITAKFAAELEYYLQNLRKRLKFPTNDNIMYDEMMKKEKLIHSGYPEVHPEHGRVTLGLCECYYKGCHKKFSSEFSLENHLNSVITNFVPKFHSSHANLMLNSAYVLEKKLTRCPSFICDKKHIVFTPEQLVYHFEELGIPGFWYKGWKPIVKIDVVKEELLAKNKKKEALEYNEKSSNAKITLVSEHPYISSDAENDTTCLCCCDAKSNVVFTKCGHQSVCWECYKKLQKAECLLCRENIRLALPVYF